MRPSRLSVTVMRGPTACGGCTMRIARRRCRAGSSSPSWQTRWPGRQRAERRTAARRRSCPCARCELCESASARPTPSTTRPSTRQASARRSSYVPRARPLLVTASRASLRSSGPAHRSCGRAAPSPKPSWSVLPRRTTLPTVERPGREDAEMAEKSPIPCCAIGDQARRRGDRIAYIMPAHDVLIIGAGLAGQRAALAAADAGASVAILSKVHPVRSHSVAAAGGINAALNPEDTWESHAFDTVKGSDYLGDQDAIEIMCREAPDEILWLEHAGVTFHRSATGHLGTRAFGGASAGAHLLRRRHHRPGDPARALRAADEAPRARSTATRSGSRPRCCRTTTAPASAASRATSAPARSRSSTRSR